jgi:hypothetical protein
MPTPGRLDRVDGDRCTAHRRLVVDFAAVDASRHTDSSHPIGSEQIRGDGDDMVSLPLFRVAYAGRALLPLLPSPPLGAQW